MEQTIIDYLKKSKALELKRVWHEEGGELPNIQHQGRNGYNNDDFIERQTYIITCPYNASDPKDTEALDRLLKKAMAGCHLEGVLQKSKYTIIPYSKEFFVGRLKVPDYEYSEVVSSRIVRVTSTFEPERKYEEEDQHITFKNDIIRKVKMFLFPSEYHAEKAVQYKETNIHNWNWITFWNKHQKNLNND